ncbi:hypothetical protein [Flavobacterium rhizosphaerae]|uniref:Uncharacterized protein n=1 Tax=Flavobacterium rhizosphaerae TaxID=3163298 RepID=A0ABW8YSN5_9FLAO
MDTKYKIIKDAFEREGIKYSNAEFSITQYSLNTPLSFKFQSAGDLFDFLNITPDKDKDKTENVNAMIMDAGLDPENFFFVNFYKSKVAEL